MKFAIVFLAILPVILSMTVEETAKYSEAFHSLTHEEKNAVTDAYHKIKSWLWNNGKAVSAASCSVACASATALETMGISAPICVAACGLIGVFG